MQSSNCSENRINSLKGNGKNKALGNQGFLIFKID